jgi:hypothetical protein
VQNGLKNSKNRGIDESAVFIDEAQRQPDKLCKQAYIRLL